MVRLKFDTTREGNKKYGKLSLDVVDFFLEDAEIME